MKLVHALAALALATSFDSGAREYNYYLPDRTAVFAPAGGFAWDVHTKIFWYYTPVRIDVTCGQFESGGTTLFVRADGDHDTSTGTNWLAPAAPQQCEMSFTRLDGDDYPVLRLPVHVYDPSKVVMITSFGDAIDAEASRPYEAKFTFTTEEGLPIQDNLVQMTASTTHGATADDLYLSFPSTTNEGVQYLTGLANNAVGEYEIIVDLQYAARWRVPVYQGVPGPGSRRHWGRM